MSLDATQTPNSLRIPAWTLGDRLRKARVVAEVRVDEMAEHLDVSPDTVTNYEKDKTRPRRSVLMAYANRCNVPLGWIEAGDGFDSQTQEADDRRQEQKPHRGKDRRRSQIGGTHSCWSRNTGMFIHPNLLGGNPDPQGSPCRLPATPCRLEAVHTLPASGTDLVIDLTAVR